MCTYSKTVFNFIKILVDISGIFLPINYNRACNRELVKTHLHGYFNKSNKKCLRDDIKNFGSKTRDTSEHYFQAIIIQPNG